MARAKKPIAVERRFQHFTRPLEPYASREGQERAAVVHEALSWVQTPYHHAAAVKGAGVDCARLLVEVFANAGLIERFDPGYYPPDWHLHRDEERYLAAIERFAKRRLADDEHPMPGDIATWRIGRCFSHGAIVVAWPQAVHAYAQSLIVDVCNVEVEAFAFDGAGHPRERRFYSLWGR